MFTNPQIDGIGSKSPGKAGREVLSEQVLCPALGTNTEGWASGRSLAGPAAAKPGQAPGRKYSVSCPSPLVPPSTTTPIHQAWERHRTHDKVKVVGCDPKSHIQLQIGGLQPSQPWLSRGAVSSHYGIPAAGGEEVTMETITKSLKLRKEAGGDRETGRP